MLQLVNLSNYCTDNEYLIKNDANILDKFLKVNNLDGIEMMFCDPWNQSLHRKEVIQGVHLKFWPSWLDFWQGNSETLLQEFGAKEKIAACYGGLKKENWLELYRQNIQLAVKAEAKYVVFHVSHARKSELFDWKFNATSETVVLNTIDLVNQFVHEIPEDMILLFENLWWPGLTLLDKNLVEKLLTSIHHKHVGIMLDTGHLMNTNAELESQEEAIDYVIDTIRNLGELKKFIRGIHLHYSLSGQYQKESRNNDKNKKFSDMDIMEHVLKIDQHQPFETQYARKIIDAIQPDFLVHEFIQNSIEDWQNKVSLQQKAIGTR